MRALDFDRSAEGIMCSLLTKSQLIFKVLFQSGSITLFLNGRLIFFCIIMRALVVFSRGFVHKDMLMDQDGWIRMDGKVKVLEFPIDSH